MSGTPTLESNTQRADIASRILSRSLDALEVSSPNGIQPSKLITTVSNDELDAFAVAQWVTITSSRLGRSAEFHGEIARSVVAEVLRCRDSGAWVLLAAGSAIDPWASRACELFSVPMMRLAVVSAKPRKRRLNEPANLSVSIESGIRMNVDAFVIAIADSVEACYVRKGGRIETCLENRVERRVDVATRVCVTRNRECAAKRLIAKGAVGRYSIRGIEKSSKRATTEERGPLLSDHRELLVNRDWMQGRGEWLIHCTRGFSGPWPGETSLQYLDSILLSNSSSTARGPLETLERIIRMRCLVDSAVATNRRQPVVCFSELPLSVLLRRRCYRSHLQRWDYEPYGVAVRFAAAKARGARPVQYGEPSQRPNDGDPAGFEFHPTGKTNDWSAECEWRILGSVRLWEFASHDVRVFAKDGTETRKRLRKSPWRVDFLN